MLVILEQVQTPSENFKPGYIPGEAEVLDPYTGVLYSAYGLTVEDAQERSDYQRRLWEKNRTFGSGRSVRA
jgi:hypothetical protein